ncbi:hypothetical protein M8C21_004575 [Ambrosia artemisiifolia]|uniref:Large ribosomal RNA subunit accumulation protein YCED homolog 1, chloroplastic n=1 Tax=Ambrosia artemisiifolia TaxID=4212 RepID=A0AAD5BK53_AMBAR|nr:hypothetical protein M8C21_004575 [Ambrosia artemisiifolia]
MPFILSSSFMTPCFLVNNVKAPRVLLSQTLLPHALYNSIHCHILQKHIFAGKHTSTILKRKSHLEFITRNSLNSNHELASDDNIMEDDWKDLEDVDDIDSPWEGAIMYQRNPTISHIEYCTTLERLGLGHISTDVSKSRASLMGLRVTKSVKDFPQGTPVMISIDVTRKKQNLKLDGIIRTVITLGCNRCGGPAADCVFSNFSLVLSEEPIEEPEIINMGVIYGQSQQEEDGEASVDLDDWLYFPPEEKVIDISKHVRDMIHLEIKINALCDPTCKGLCLKCGQNLNNSSCNCSQQGSKSKGYGPLGGLKEKMQQ